MPGRGVVLDADRGVAKTAEGGSLSMPVYKNLTYKAKSDKPSVATVKVDDEKDTLTVTAVGPGTATITVTATAQGSATQTKTFTVTVPQPASEATVPIVKTGARRTASVVIGTPWTVALSTVFDGATSYAATSSPSTIATASESGETLTITGVSAGTATITVTGTNAAGDTPHQIVATVTPADTGDTGGTGGQQGACTQSTRALTITINTREKCTLSAKHSLIYDPPVDEDPGVTVTGPTGDNVWTITALKKGKHEVHISKDAATKTEGTITVTVPNTEPQRTEKYTYTADTYEITSPPVGPFELLGGTGKVTHEFNPGAFFADVDTGDDPPPPGIVEADGTTQGSFRFRVYQKPEGVLIGLDSGYVAVRKAVRESEESAAFSKDLTNVPIEAEAIILKNPNPGSGDRTYDILLYAYDISNGESNSPVTLRVTAQNPVSPALAAGYSLVKDTGNTYDQTEEIGNRIGVYHKINLRKDDPQYDFLDFITKDDIEKEIKTVAAEFSEDVDVEGELCKPLTGFPTSVSTANEQGDGCWSISTSSKVTIYTAADDTITKPKLSGTDPDKHIHFRLDPDHQLNASDVKITMGYYVVARADDTTTPETNELDIEKVGGDRTLTVDIHRCVDVAKCP